MQHIMLWFNQMCNTTLSTRAPASLSMLPVCRNDDDLCLVPSCSQLLSSVTLAPYCRTPCTDFRFSMFARSVRWSSSRTGTTQDATAVMNSEQGHAHYTDTCMCSMPVATEDVQSTPEAYEYTR